MYKKGQPRGAALFLFIDDTVYEKALSSVSTDGAK